MKIDYNKLMQEEISSFGDKPKLLLHCCCAPCSSAVIERIKEFFDITFYYYNPNIFPKEEYDLREQEFEKLGVKVISANYNHDEFLNLVKGKENEKEGGTRCQICIAKRMDETFKFAVVNNFDVVTTTLSISPHKDCEYINMLGERLQEKYGVKYLHADFKKQNGYLRSIEICKDLGIYRQDYCGCEFSINSSKQKND
ncbi:MAG: epoxyqueuosine reductase QueH [Clostridia bacterium]|nr:epoxyqueuosine reductase QueH [Clostridia bacterium]